MEKASDVPSNVSAEQSVLGAILLDSKVIERVAPIISSEDFYDRRNEYIYRGMIHLYEQGQSVTPVPIQNYLMERNLLDLIGGPEYLGAIANCVADTDDAEDIARIVRKMSTLRSLIERGNRIKAVGYNTALDDDEAVNQAEKLLYEVSAQRTTREYRPLSEGVQAYYRHIESLYGKEIQITGVPSGFEGIDYLTQGFPIGLSIVAGRPGSGKSSWLFQVAMNAAKAGYPAGVFSLEMSESESVHRMLSLQAEIDNMRLRNASITESEYEKFILSVADVSELPIWFDDTPSLPVIEFRSKVRRMQSEHGIKVVFIDYLQLMTTTSGGNDFQQVTEVSNTLRRVSRELKIPIVALAQLNRKAEDGNDSPQLSHLRSSGSLEQDAHVVIFIWSDEEERDPNGPDFRNFTVAKNRNGPLGNVKLRFDGEFTKFREWDVLNDGMVRADD